MRHVLFATRGREHTLLQYFLIRFVKISLVTLVVARGVQIPGLSGQWLHGSFPKR